MTSLIPNLPPSPQELQFKQQLELFSHPGVLKGKLIVKEQGTLGQTNFLHALWEKFKGICGFRNWTNERLVEFKTLQFLSEGKKWVNSQQDIERVKILASRAGLTASTQNDHRELQLLVEEICQTPLKSEKKEETTDDLLTKFVIHYKKELQPFPKEILNVAKVFDQAIPQQVVLAPTDKQVKEEDLAEKERETESEDDPTSTSQQDSGHAQDHRSSEVPSLPVLPEENILPNQPIPKIDNSHLLKIPELSDESPQEVTGPLFPTIEEEKTTLIDQNETLPVKVLTPKELSSSKWKTAGKVALIAVGTLAVLAATYYAWQYFGSTTPDTANDHFPPLDPTKSPSSEQAPQDLVSQITSNFTERVISLIYPSPQAPLIAQNSTIIEQVAQGFTPLPQADFFEQFTPANIVDTISLPNPLDIVPALENIVPEKIIEVAADLPNIIEATIELPQNVIDAATHLIEITKEVVQSSLPVCLPGDNPALSSNTSIILDFISGLEDHSLIPTPTPSSFIPIPEDYIPLVENAHSQGPSATPEEVVQTVVEQASYIKEICGAIFLTLGAAGAALYRFSNNKLPETQEPLQDDQNQAPPILEKQQDQTEASVRKNYSELSEDCYSLQVFDKAQIFDKAQKGTLLLQIPKIQEKVHTGLVLSEATLGEIFHIANQYTTNTPYFEGSHHQMNVDYTNTAGKPQNAVIQRPNHNGTHSARQVRGLEATFDLIEAKASKEMKDVFGSLTDLEKANLKLGAYFLRAGRVDEGGHAVGDDYNKRSALVYKAYAEQLGVEEPEINRMMRLIEDSCKPLNQCSQETQNNPKDRLCYELLSLTHVMDLIRVTPNEKQFQIGGKSFIEMQNGVEYILGHSDDSQTIIVDLVAFATKLCNATGITVFTSNIILKDATTFVECSNNGKHCWEVVSKVPSPWPRQAPQTKQKPDTELKKQGPDELGENAASSSQKASRSKSKKNRSKQTTSASQLLLPTLLTAEEISKMSPDQKGELIDKYAVREKTGKSQLSLIQLRGMLRSSESPPVKMVNEQETGLGHCGRYCINNALQNEVLSQKEFLAIVSNYFVENLQMSQEDAQQLVSNPNDFGVDSDIISYIFKEKFGVDLRSEKISDLVQPGHSKQKTLEEFIGESDWAIIANSSDTIYEMPSLTNAQYPFTKGHLTALSKDETGKWWYIDSRSPKPINIDLAIIPSSCTIITSDRKASSLIPLPEIEKEDEHTEIKAKEKAPDQPKTTHDKALEDQKKDTPLIPDLNELTAEIIKKRLGKISESTPNRAEKIKAYTQRLQELEGTGAASSSRTTSEGMESPPIPQMQEAIQPPLVTKEPPVEELARRRESGSKILAQWLQNNTLTFHGQPIANTKDYYRLLIEKSYKAMNFYSTLYQISTSLNKFKESELLNLSKGDPGTAKRLHDIHDALLALEGHKEIFLNKLLNNNQDFELIFKHIQDFIGHDTDFPIDFKIALILLLSTKELKRNLLTYLQVATSEKHKTLDPTIELSTSSSGKNQGNPIQAYFSNEIQPEAFNSLSTFDDYSGPNLIADLNAFHMWVVARAGSEINTQIITDSIELGLQTKTKDTDREINAVQRNKSLAPFLPQEEKQLAEDGFRPWLQYGINVKNEWQENASVIHWKVTIASKKPDGSYKRQAFTDTIDLNKLNGFTDQDKKIALKFIADHCQSGKSIKGRESLFFAPVYLQSILNNDPDFWRWINIGSPASDEKADIYSQLLPSIIEKYTSLLHLAHDFSETIQKASIKTFVDTSQDLSKVKDMPEMVFNDTSFADEEDVFDPEGNDVVNIEIGNQLPQDPLAQQGSPSSWGVLGTIGNAVLNAGTLAVSPLRSVGGIIATTTTNALQGFNQAIADPLWATTKYKLALSMFDSINITGLKTSKLKAGLEQLLSAQKMSKEHATSRYAHTLFLESLRAMLSSTEFQEELKKKIDKKPYDASVDIILQICQIRFEEGHLYTFCDNLIAEVLPADKHTGELADSDFDVIDAVASSKRLLGAEVSAKKLAGHLNLGFDPHLQGNIPFVLGTVEIGGKSVKLLRTGTPTIEGFVGKAEINPEFRGYIQQLQFAGKKHLYISLQNDKSKNFVSGDESGRNGAIKGLQEDFPETFFAVVLAQDSRFYKQVDKLGKPLGVEDAGEFTSTFYKQMILPGDTGFYFPPKWKEDPDFKLGLQQLLEDVHTTVFDGKENLTRQEKQDFIEIYYAYLAIFLMNYSKADNANITCKDAIDRAGKLNSLVLKLIMTIQGKARDKEQLRIHQVFTHAPAYFVKSQAIINSHSTDTSNGRRERLMSAHHKMTNEKVAKRIQKNSVTALDRTRRILPINPHGTIKII